MSFYSPIISRTTLSAIFTEPTRMNAHVLNAIDAKHYDEGVRLFQDAVQNILSAVLDPIPIDKLTQGRAEAPVPNDERNDVYRKEVM